jgi:hypothetical protein
LGGKLGGSRSPRHRVRRRGHRLLEPEGTESSSLDGVRGVYVRDERP